ncbi:PDR/VanB family oxidoreductase [Gordonia sp. NB41Y]|uniref:PDR/VanB family oxidoreductase n=1 Tax=Gordonia sp. NB41Y TaxID=875808 RepID=UPI00273C8A86|nr:PDR/VanB family oxidoreductase [Gordonia sp. NB41Y]WLP92913.1 PDR/VanB family oxidoreductase [Gordonia sp. NB41Y]
MTLVTDAGATPHTAPAPDGTLQLVVTAITRPGADIATFTLADPAGRPLPAFPPGSHLVVQAGTKTNAYSLTSDGTHPGHYSISVLRVDDGDGGSRWLHEHLNPGDSLSVRLPRSAFAPLARARKHLLIAAGIGVTPVVSHLRVARRWGRRTQVLYTYRPDNAAHVDDVVELTDGAAELFTGRAQFLPRLDAALREQPIGTHLYVCGPGTLIDHVVSAATAAGWPASRIHFERFGIDALDAGDPFTVRLSATDRILDVPSGTSMLEAMEAAGVSVPNLCRQGVCGECRIPVSAGTPIHRDLYLTDDEKTACDAVMPCVSRAADGATLEVPL